MQTKTSHQIGNVEVDPRKAVVALEAFVAGMLSSHPWTQDEGKTSSSLFLVPEGLRDLGASQANVTSGWLQHMVLYYLFDDYELPKTWSGTFGTYALGGALTWWAKRPDDFRKATDHMMAELKTSVINDPDKDNYVDADGDPVFTVSLLEGTVKVLDCMGQMVDPEEVFDDELFGLGGYIG